MFNKVFCIIQDMVRHHFGHSNSMDLKPLQLKEQADEQTYQSPKTTTLIGQTHHAKYQDLSEERHRGHRRVHDHP